MATAEALLRADRIIDEKKRLRFTKKQSLLLSLKKHLPEIVQLSQEFDRVYEDGIYRFYHCSFKVYFLQESTQKAITLFNQIANEASLEFFNPFKTITEEGTGKEFDLSHNKDWSHHTRPIVEAFLHAKYLIEMLGKYSQELDDIPEILPSGFAAILCLYKLR